MLFPLRYANTFPPSQLANYNSLSQVKTFARELNLPLNIKNSPPTKLLTFLPVFIVETSPASVYLAVPTPPGVIIQHTSPLFRNKGTEAIPQAPRDETVEQQLAMSNAAANRYFNKFVNMLQTTFSHCPRLYSRDRGQYNRNHLKSRFSRCARIAQILVGKSHKKSVFLRPIYSLMVSTFSTCFTFPGILQRKNYVANSVTAIFFVPPIFLT